MPLNSSRPNSRLDLLYQVTSEFNAGLDLDINEVLLNVLTMTVAAMNTTEASLFVVGDHGELEISIFICDSEQQVYPADITRAVFATGLTGWVWRHKESALVADTASDKRWYRPPILPEQVTALSAVSVPILKSPEVPMGVLTITAKEPDFFDDNDVAMLTIIANQAAFALTNTRLYHAEIHRRRIAESLGSIAHTINSTLNLAEVLSLILEQLALVVDYDSSSILLYEDDQRTLSVQAARGFDDMTDALNVRLPFDEQIPNYQAIIQKTPILIGDVDAEPHWIKSSSSRNVKSWIGAPLIARNEVVGILTVDSYEVNKYSPDNVKVVAAFAEQAATAVANAQAVTQLQKAEASYSALFEDSTDMILITDYDGVILNVNRKGCQIMRRPKDAITGLSIIFFAPMLKTFLSGHIDQLRVWRDASVEVEITDAYRQRVPLDIRVRHIQFGDKARLEWVGRDISRRKEIERMRQDLVNMLVHDLRGPLGNLINTIDLVAMMIERSSDDKNLMRFLEMGKRTGRTLTDLVDSMLDVSRLEQGEVPLQRGLTRIDELLEEVKDQVAPQAENKDISLTFEPVPEAIPEIWLDNGLIRRVLVNLLGNAIKYAPEEAEVSLATTLSGDQLHFAVTDNGPGISKHNQARIFDKFSRLEYGANSPAGVGLGLAFCKLAVEAHGGAISVQSNGIPGEGSIFHVLLPAITEPD